MVGAADARDSKFKTSPSAGVWRKEAFAGERASTPFPLSRESRQTAIMQLKSWEMKKKGGVYHKSVIETIFHIETLPA